MKLNDVEKQIGGIDLEKLARIAHRENVEIAIDIEPDNASIRIEPWKPISYNCPFDTREGVKNDPEADDGK